MKRYLAVFFTLAALAASVLPALAGPHWVVREVKWKVCSNQTNGIPCRDTAFTVAGASVIDTTNWVLLDRLYVNPYSVTTDSIRVACWIFQSDSATAYTASLTAMTVATDIGPYFFSSSSNPAVLEQSGSTSVQGGASQLVTSGHKIVVSPIVLPVALLSLSIADAALGVQFLPIRARITGSTGAQGLAQCRAFIAYMRDEP